MYPYHNKIKQRISNGELVGYEYIDYKFSDGLQPCLMLQFSTNPFKRPIREHRFKEYEKLLKI